MKTLLPFAITPQPDEATCGPSCLHAVYRFFGAEQPLEETIAGVRTLPGGGTLAVMLALHAMDRGYEATIYSCNLHLIDPSWMPGGVPVSRALVQEKLRAQVAVKRDVRLQLSTEGYLEFLARGGDLRMEDLTPSLIGGLIGSGSPVIAGLSATWLYRSMRERPGSSLDDDILGEPTGHFVVLHGIDEEQRLIQVADPWLHHPKPGSHAYAMPIDRVVGAIQLGIATYDAALVVLRPS